MWHRFEPTWGEGKKKQVSIEEVHAWIREMKSKYHLRKIVLDQYNSAATIQAFGGTGGSTPAKGSVVEELTWTVPSKMQAYGKIRELFNSNSIEIYNHPKAIQQLRNLQVVRSPNGNWNVTGGNASAVDDYASALAGVVLAAEKFMPQWRTTPCVWSH